MRHFALFVLIGWKTVACGEESALSPLEDAVSKAELIAIIEVSNVERYQGGGGHRPFITISTGRCRIVETISVRPKNAYHSQIQDQANRWITSTDDGESNYWTEQLRNGRFLAFLNCEFDGARGFDADTYVYLGVIAAWGALSPVHGDEIDWTFGHNRFSSKEVVIEQIRKVEERVRSLDQKLKP